MGTNYYLESKPPCQCCGRPYEDRHIGKSSCGWVFALHVYPEEGIHDLDDWLPLFANGVIKDEYGKQVSAQEMLENITERRHSNHRYEPATTYRAIEGPSGLLRRRLDNFTIGHGEGTWDLCVGEFS